MKSRNIIVIIFASLSVALILWEVKTNMATKNDYLKVETQNILIPAEPDSTYRLPDNLWQNTEFIE